MVRGTSIVLGAGLIVLWLVGLGNHATAWLTWLDGVGALCAFAIAAAVIPERVEARLNAAVGSPIALSVGLFVLWIIALATGATSWMAWWTFAFACAFLILGLLAITSARTTTTPTVPRTI